MRGFIPYFMPGLISMLLQVIVLREMLAVFSGNELDVGITLSFWLLYAGLGSLAGWRIRHKGAFGLSFLLVSFLSVPTILAIKNIRPIFSIAPGESVSFALTLLSTAVCLFPLCFTLGLQFPLAVSYENKPPGRIYGIEAGGAFTAGIIFTFLISGRAPQEWATASAAVLSILAASYVLKRKFVIIFVVIPLALYPFLNYAGRGMGGMEVVRQKESRYGKIVVLKEKGQFNVYQSGGLLFSYPEPQTEELRAHIPMTVHPSPERILEIGGSPGALREFLKYPIECLDFVEIDPELVEVSIGLINEGDRKALKKALKDGRLKIIVEDGRSFLKGLRAPADKGLRSPAEYKSKGPCAPYDLIVLNLPPPSTSNMNRFYTYEFFNEAKGALREGGMLFLTLQTSSGYMGRSTVRANGSIYNSLKAAFGHVGVSSHEYGVFFASGSPIDSAPHELIKRFEGRKIKTRYFDSYILEDAFSALKVDYVKERLGSLKDINTDGRPAAYLYNLMLWAEASGGGPLKRLLERSGLDMAVSVSVLLLAFLVFALRQRGRAISYSIFTAGYSGMAFMLAIILAYQAAYGYVYETIGLVTASFMVGVSAGACLTKNAGRPLKKILLLELAAIGLALSAPLFFGHEALFYAFGIAGGAVTGSEFALANLAYKDAPGHKTAGVLYGFDLIGSFLGASLTAIALVPLYGIGGSLYFIIGLKVFSIILIYSVINEKD
jgi:spermidine synthase